MAGSWCSTVSKVPSGAFRQVAAGTLSLRQFEAERYQVAAPNDPAVIRGVILAANLTMEHGTLADRKALIDYVISPGSTQAMPAGHLLLVLEPEETAAAGATRLPTSPPPLVPARLSHPALPPAGH